MDRVKVTSTLANSSDSTTALRRLSGAARMRLLASAPIAVPTYADLARRWPTGTRTVFSPTMTAILLFIAALAASRPVASDDPRLWLGAALLVTAALYRPVSWLVPQANFVRAPIELVEPRMWVVPGHDPEAPLGLAAMVQAAAVTAVFRDYGRHDHPYLIALSNGNVTEGPATQEVILVQIVDAWANRRLDQSEAPPEDTDALFALLAAVHALIPRTSRHGVTDVDLAAVRRQLSGWLGRQHLHTADASVGEQDQDRWQLDHFDSMIARATRLGLLRPTRRSRSLAATAAGHVWFAQQVRERGLEEAERNGNGVIVHNETVINYSIRDSEVSGPTIIAGQIQESLIQVTTCSASEDVQLLLYDLGRAIGQAALTAAPELAEGMSREFASVTAELASAAPRSNWLAFALQNIRDAATQVGAAGAPIIDLATKLKDLLS